MGEARGSGRLAQERVSWLGPDGCCVGVALVKARVAVQVGKL